MKKAFTIIGLVILACAGVLGCQLSREGIVIDISQKQLQEKLDARFPISKRYLMLLELTLSDPRVALREGSDRIGFGVSATTNVRVNREDLAGTAHVTAGVQYKPEEGALLLVDPEVETLTISLLPEEYEDEVMAAATVAAKEFLNDYEVYRLDQSDYKQALAGLLIKDVAVRGGALRITLGLGKH